MLIEQSPKKWDWQLGFSNNKNHIVRYSPKTPDSVLPAYMKPEVAVIEVSYYDGLGRPSETVLVQNGGSLVAHQEYDGMGRESNSWLPVRVPGNYGLFVSLDDVKTCSNTVYGDTKAYSKPVYEASPLNRPVEQYGPGQAWHDNGRSVKTSYLTNISGHQTLNSLRFTVTDGSGNTNQVLNRIGNYATSELLVTRTEDEDGKNITFEFRDKLDRVVLVRQLSGTINYDTYYVYDDYGNLMAVLPPKASDTLADASTSGSWDSSTDSTLQQLGYLYKYDGQNRCIAKKLPGCDWVYYVYDTADQLIFSQDGEQRLREEWSFILPDALGRPCVTGICRNSFNHLTGNPLSMVVKTTRNNVSGPYKGYAFTGIALTSPQVLAVNYYDDYGFRTLPEFSASHFAYNLPSDFGNA